MAGPVIARATVQVDLDGKRIPAQAEVLGREAGEAASRGYKSESDRTLSKIFDDVDDDIVQKSDQAGKDSGSAFSKAYDKQIRAQQSRLVNNMAKVFSNTEGFDEFRASLGEAGKGFEGIDHTVNTLNGHIDELSRNGHLAAGEYVNLRSRVEEWGEEAERVEQPVQRAVGFFDRLGLSIERTAAQARGGQGAFDGAGKSIGNLAKSFSDFDPTDNLGQAILLIIALAPQVAVLANAAAGGLLILGGAATAAGIGALGLVLAFKDVLKPLNTFPAVARPAVAAIQDLVGKTELVNKKMQFVPGKIQAIETALQSHVFAGLAKDIEQVTKVAIPAFVSGAGVVGDALNTLIRGFTVDLASKGFSSDLKQIFAGVAPVIVDIGNAARAAFGVVGQLLIDVLPSTHEFTAGLVTALDEFNKFLRSPEGKNAVNDFLSNAKRTLADVGDAIVKVGGALVRLITPQNIENTTKVLQGLADSGPQLAKFANDLNVVIVGIAGFVDVLSHVAGAVGGFFDQLFSLGDTFAVQITNLFGGISRAVAVVVGQLGSEFATVGKAISQALAGNFAGAADTIRTGLGNIQKSASAFNTAIAGALGNTSAIFSQLDATSQRSLLDLASRFDVPQSKAVEFGAKISELAAAAGVSIGQIAHAKSWTDLQTVTGAASGTIEDLKKEFGSLPASKSTKVTVDGAVQSAAQVKSFQDQVNRLTGKLVSVKEDGSAASKARVADLQGQIARLIGKQVSVKENGSAASSTRVKDLQSQIRALVGKLVAVKESGAADSDARVKALRGQIAALAGKIVRVGETGASSTIGAINSVRAALAALPNSKTINISQITRNIQGGGGGVKGGAVGGVIAGGRFIEGGRAFANGGIVRSPTWLSPYALSGEAGSEAIVPLTGSLAAVDASVRGLSAVARGMVAEGRTGAYIAPGAVTVYSNAADSRIVASQVIDRLVPLGA